jgi:hypothetical protein
MKIKPTYVTFEQAKLLKEKGFDEITKSIYQYDNLEIDNDYVNFRNSLFSYDYFEISAPEQWQVVEYFRLKYGFWVIADYYNNGDKDIWFYNYKTKNKESMDEGFNTPQEAYSAAFDYVLKELI